MPPLQRQETRGSLRSWWSDSNPMLHISPTINIHALAKPLMRFMYHRQALGIMELNRDAPLSKELLEIYLSYLSSNHVSRATQKLVQEYVWERVIADPEATDRLELYSPFLDDILHMLESNTGPLESSDRHLLRLVCSVMETLLLRCFGVGNVFDSRKWEPILWNESNSAKKTIMLDITSILGVCRTSQAVAIALLESDNVETRQYTWLLIHYLDGFTQMALIQTIPTEKWGHILRQVPSTPFTQQVHDIRSNHVSRATQKLVQEYVWERVIADPEATDRLELYSPVLDDILHVLESLENIGPLDFSEFRLQRLACLVMETLLLRGLGASVSEFRIWDTAKLWRWRDLESNDAMIPTILDIRSILGACRTPEAIATELLESDNEPTRRYTWLLVQDLDWSTQIALIKMIPTEKWGNILSKGNQSFQEELISVLIKIAGRPNGAAGIITADILEALDLHWDQKKPAHLHGIFTLLKCLVKQDFSVPAILKTNLVKKFAHACCRCLDQSRFDCREINGHLGAELPVEELAENADLAAAIWAGIDPEHLQKGFTDAKTTCTRTRLCILVNALAKHDGLVPGLIQANIIGQLVERWRHDYVPRVSRKAAVALASISRFPHNATAIVEALGGMENLMELLTSPQRDRCHLGYPCTTCYLFIFLTRDKRNVARFFQSPQSIERLEHFVSNPQAHEDASLKAAALLADLGQPSEAGAPLVNMARISKCIRERATTPSASHKLRRELEQLTHRVSSEPFTPLHYNFAFDLYLVRNEY
ncbi:hypothetical protein FB45DRAFT_1068702 [Roridomyces roridus]|uniref:Uncharacterized protein n=1 Tax=Roridomyces roridus TaxID=1738132 RepID=A0AAD7F916_9AGAR|nr:hypothetical protein FB45DRAFT_1068702 [Roridomyces roridus]